MHQVLMDGLEQYIAGAPNPEVERVFRSHIAVCEECRSELQNMQEVSAMFASLRAVERVEPSLGFYKRLERQLMDNRQQSFWSFPFLDPGFGRRVVFASLLTLAVLGSYLISSEREFGPPSPEAVMAIEQSPSVPESSPQHDRDMMLVTLTTYRP